MTTAHHNDLKALGILHCENGSHERGRDCTLNLFPWTSGMWRWFVAVRIGTQGAPPGRSLVQRTTLSRLPQWTSDPRGRFSLGPAAVGGIALCVAVEDVSRGTPDLPRRGPTNASPPDEHRSWVLIVQCSRDSLRQPRLSLDRLAERKVNWFTYDSPDRPLQVSATRTSWPAPDVQQRHCALDAGLADVSTRRRRGP
jgi:hypothetical protein